MKLSVVTTLYNSKNYIASFHERMCAELKKITSTYEIIFVDDGSADNSVSCASELIKHDPNVKVIELTRNFGHHKAIMCGLLHATGDFVFLIDVDLEEEPEWLGDFWKRINEDDQPDVVHAINKTTSDFSAENLFRQMFYRFFNSLSDISVPSNILTVRLFRRHMIDKMRHFQTKQVYIAAIITSIGCKQVGVLVKKTDRNPTSYSFIKKIQLFTTAITSFSAKPLYMLFYFGLMTFALSAVTIIGFLIQQLYMGLPIAGWTSLILSIWLLGGCTISAIGVCGIYIGRIFNEVKEQPQILVKKVHEAHAS